MSDKGFDLRWKEYPKPQATVRSTWVEKAGFAPELLRGKSVLDAGCGCGRNLVMLQQAGVTDLWGCDISPTGVQAAQENTGLHDNIWRADLLARECCWESPNFTGAEFDFVFSHGVLHHTGNTRLAFHNVAACVKPSGVLNVWVYTQPAEDRLMPFVRFLHTITRACPPEALMVACREFAPLIRDLNKASGEFGPLQQVLQVSGSADDDECISDTFDWHCPQHRDYHSGEEVMGWFEEEGFEVIWVGQFPVSMTGVRRV